MTKKKGPGQGPNAIDTSNSSAAQRQRLLAALREGPKSTVWLRRELDIMMPAARVHELRHREGFNILTHRRCELTESGRHHNVAEYILLSGKWQGGQHYECE